MTDKTQNSKKIKDRLLKEIYEAARAGEDRMAPEVEMAEKLHVSRQMIRDCLSSLEQEGYVTRVHGVGTLINRHVIEAGPRLDIEKEFLPMLRGAGYKAKVAKLSVAVEEADEETAGRLEIPVGSEVVSVARTVTADGTPAIYCVDRFARDLCPQEAMSREKLRGSASDFLAKECGLELQMDIAELKVLRAGGELAEIFGIKETDVLLGTYETGYDFFGTPRIFSKVFYRPGVMKHMVVRKKIG